MDFDRLKHSILKGTEKLRLIQENKALVEHLRRSNEQLSNLSEMKSKFMSMSSHDLSNSLMTLQVSFEMLSQTIQPNDEQKKRLQAIKDWDTWLAISSKIPTKDQRPGSIAAPTLRIEGLTVGGE